MYIVSEQFSNNHVKDLDTELLTVEKFGNAIVDQFVKNFPHPIISSQCSPMKVGVGGIGEYLVTVCITNVAV